MKRKIDIIIPVHNEEKNVGILYDRIKRVESESGLQFGIIFIDDGSTDSTIEKLQSITRNNSGAMAIQLRRNYGKSTALDVGFRASQAPMIITMDGDLQDDPAEIPRLIETIDQGYDVVSGWKKKRHDPWHKTMPSKLFNLVTSLVSGVKLHDFNCGFKAYRQDVVKSIKIYGEMHRFIPAIAHWKGFRVTEIPVVHHPREFGHSKYGVERLLKGLFDFLTIAFITKYFKRPMHLFGLLGLTLFIIGLIINGYLVVDVVTFGQPKVTNQEGAPSFANLPLLRFVNRNDVVPHLPPDDFVPPANLVHFGPEVILYDGPYYAYLEADDSDYLTSTSGDLLVITPLIFNNEHSNVYLARIRSKLAGAQQIPYLTQAP